MQRMRSSRPEQSEDGFTLVELLVVIVILAIVGGVTVTGLVQGMRTTSEIEARTDALVQLEMAGQRAERELRRGVWSVALTTAGQPPKGCVVPAVSDAGTSSTLRDDELSMVIFHSGERFLYRLSLEAGTLRLEEDRWSGAAWVDVADRVLIDGLTNEVHGVPLITYLGTDGRPLELSDGGTYTNLDIAKVKKYRLQLRTDVDGTDPIELETLVSPRNRVGSCPVIG